MKYLKTGATRRVFLIGKYAFKIPFAWPGSGNAFRGIRSRLRDGIFANRCEVVYSGMEFSDNRVSFVCNPVVFSLPCGLLVVQRRAIPIDYETFDTLEEACAWSPVEYKPDSFGFVDGKLVAVDYGAGSFYDWHPSSGW
jgi:hypothetical protein